MKPNLWEIAPDLAVGAGAERPTAAESSDGGPVIVDTETGDCYRVIITVEKF